MKIYRSFPMFAITLVAILCNLPLAHAATQTEEATYPLNRDGRIQLANINGRVEVRAWDGEGVKLAAIKKGRTEEIVADIKILVESSPDRLSIRTELARVKRGWWRGTTREGEVNYTLLVPATAGLENIDTVNGSVQIEGISGPVRATTVNGSIRGDALAGAAEFETVNGNIEFHHSKLGEDARLRASSVNGSIEVHLPADQSAALRASTVNGAIHSDFSFTTTSDHSRRKVEARIREGGARIELSTVNGGIRVREAGNEHAAAR